MPKTSRVVKSVLRLYTFYPSVVTLTYFPVSRFVNFLISFRVLSLISKFSFEVLSEQTKITLHVFNTFTKQRLNDSIFFFSFFYVTHEDTTVSHDCVKIAVQLSCRYKKIVHIQSSIDKDGQNSNNR